MKTGVQEFSRLEIEGEQEWSTSPRTVNGERRTVNRERRTANEWQKKAGSRA